MVMEAKQANWPTEMSEENKLIVENMANGIDLKEAADKNAKGDGKAYDAFIAKLLKKYKVDSIEDLGDRKKEFFDEVDAGWKADKETD